MLVLSAGQEGTPATPSPVGISETASVPPLPAIDSAFATVQANDGDAGAHRRLAEALMASGRTGEAVKELERAAELYMERGEHLKAATVLMQAMRFVGGPANAEPELVERLSRALFLGAADPGAADLFGAAQEFFPRRDMLTVCEARAYVLGGEAERADKTLQPVLTSNPENAMAQAVMVEILLARGRNDEARELVEGLLARPDLPKWLAEHLSHLRETIPA
jgi:tetratricopeptide (TPR) repeat protein